MSDSVPGSDVVRLTPPAEGFTAQDLDNYAGALRRLATPYSVDKRGRATPSSYVASTLTPASGLISSIRDLEKLDLDLKNGRFIRSASWLTLMFTPPSGANSPTKFCADRPLPRAFRAATRLISAPQTAKVTRSRSFRASSRHSDRASLPAIPA